MLEDAVGRKQIMWKIGNLFEKIISLENLYLADENARKKKQNTHGVIIHDKNRKENLEELHNDLKNKTFSTSRYNSFKINETKERIVSNLPYYPDRIVHHAIMNIIEPFWSKLIPYNSYACLKERGLTACANQVSKNIYYFRNSENLYCLKIDIKQFYPSINHEILKNIIRKRIKDNDLLWLLDEIIDSTRSDIGIPIGNYVSQFFANLYLADFMHYVNGDLLYDVQRELKLEERPAIKATAYCDDIVFLSDRKDILWKVFNLIKNKIENLKLVIKENWKIFPIGYNRFDVHGNALDYVGFCFYRNQKTLRKRIKKNFCKKAHKLNKKEDISEIKYKQEISPWLGWLKHSDSYSLYKKIITRDL